MQTTSWSVKRYDIVQCCTKLHYRKYNNKRDTYVLVSNYKIGGMILIPSNPDTMV